MPRYPRSRATPASTSTPASTATPATPTDHRRDEDTMTTTTGTTPDDAAPVGTTALELEIGGMTCASCAMRIEKKLNKLDGVTASVNYATEKARVDTSGPIDPELLIAEVE